MNEETVEGENFDYQLVHLAQSKFCIQYCHQTYDKHIHTDYLYEDLVDDPNILQKYNPITRNISNVAHCKVCGYISIDLEKHRYHMENKHREHERALECIIANCEYRSAYPEKIINHMAVKHEDEMKTS